MKQMRAPNSGIIGAGGIKGSLDARSTLTRLALVSWAAMSEYYLRWVFGVSGRPLCAEAQRRVESLSSRLTPRPLLPSRGRICGPAEAESLRLQARLERVQGWGAGTSADPRRLP